MNRAITVIATVITLIAVLPAAVAQGSYPSQPVRMIIATAPGGGLDTFTRLVANELSKRSGQQFIADNRPGAGTTIGSSALARAKPDGYTLMMNTSSFAISPAIYRKLPYDPLRDFTPIMMAVATPNLMVVHPSVPVKSVKELIAFAKGRAAKGDALFYASGGTGTNGHLSVALFLDMANVRMTHVPYKSGSLGVVDLRTGQVAMMIDSMSSLMPHVQAGKLRALGVSSARRVASAAEIPTISEAGVPGYESGQWYGLFAPAGTPQGIIQWLHKEVTAALSPTKTREQFAKKGLQVVANEPHEFAAQIKADIAKWTKLVKATGIPQM